MAESYRWAVWEKKSGECIGQIAFCKTWDDIRTAEIEYCIGQRFQGDRYAGEALKDAADRLHTAAANATGELKDIAAAGFRSLVAGWEEAKKTFGEVRKNK